MIIGVSLYVVKDSALDDALAAVAEAGFAQVELASDGIPDLWRTAPARVREKLAALGLAARTAHSFEAGWDNDAPDDAVRRASVDVASSNFPALAAIGVETVVVHPNARTTHDFVESEREANVARAVESIKILAGRAASHGLRLAVENMPRRGTPRPGGAIGETLAMIEGLGVHVGVCVDTGHANANGLAPADELRRAAGRVFAVHLQDTDGKGEDQHLLPGEGTIDWPATLGAIARFAPDAAVNFEVPSGDSVTLTLAKLADIRRRFCFSPSPLEGEGRGEG